MVDLFVNLFYLKNKYSKVKVSVKLICKIKRKVDNTKNIYLKKYF